MKVNSIKNFKTLDRKNPNGSIELFLRQISQGVRELGSDMQLQTEIEIITLIKNTLAVQPDVQMQDLYWCTDVRYVLLYRCQICSDVQMSDMHWCTDVKYVLMYRFQICSDVQMSDMYSYRNIWQFLFLLLNLYKVGTKEGYISLSLDQTIYSILYPNMI